MQESGSKAKGDASKVPHSSLDSYPSEICDSSLWLGEELTRRDDWLLRLDPDEVNAISEAQARAAREKLAGSQHTLDLTDVLQPLSERLRRIQDRLEQGSGATCIRGFPLTDCTAIEAQSSAMRR